MVVPSSIGDVVIGTGKEGYVFGLDPRNGRTLWKRRVGKHHNDHVQSFVGSIKVFPGEFGGVETPPAAADGVVYVPVLNEPTTYQPSSPGFGGTIGTMDGEVVAIDVTTGPVRWDVKVPGDPLGGATVVGDLVFTGLQDGRILALSRRRLDRVVLPGQRGRQRLAGGGRRHDRVARSGATRRRSCSPSASAARSGRARVPPSHRRSAATRGSARPGAAELPCFAT